MAAVWAMGITQHTTGVFNVLALANLQMLLGNLGIPGGGVNPLRGQNNVQGACDMGALPNVLPGYRSIADPAARNAFAQAWALSGQADPFGSKPGLTVTELIDAAGRGSVRALYILGENPVMTDPDVNHVRGCLDAARVRRVTGDPALGDVSLCRCSSAWRRLGREERYVHEYRAARSIDPRSGAAARRGARRLADHLRARAATRSLSKRVLP